MGSEGAGGSVTIRLGFFFRQALRDGLPFVQSSGSMSGVQSDHRDSSERHCSTFLLQQRPPPNQSVELTATRRTTMFSDD